MKIMDPNGVIINVDDISNNIMNLSYLISRYALNTSYLSSELENYANEKTFLSAILLGIRYVDFTIFADETLRPELMDVATVYLDESERLLSSMAEDDKKVYLQKIELVKIEGLLILNKYRKASRQLKRINDEDIDRGNEALYAFLNYTAFKLMEDEINAEVWKSKISSLNLKRAELILKNNLNGNVN